jgi:uncharacterized protein (TIGR02246 family)
MSAKNRQTVEAVNAAFARGDTEGFLSRCADDVVWTMVGEKTVRGKTAIREWMGSVPAEPPAFTVDSLFTDGDLATCVGAMTMKDQDGATTSHDYCDVYRFKGEAIVELKSFVIKTDGASG